MPSKIVDYLPQFDVFLREMTAKVQAGQIASWQPFVEQCTAFYTPQMMDEIDAVIPFWKKMPSYADSITRTHVTSVFVALMCSDEYQQLTPHQQSLAEWGVAFHDVTKIPVRGGHDYIHGVRSAAVAGKALTYRGFPLREGITQADVDAWYNLTWNATVYSDKHNETIQDISKFLHIISELQRIHHEDAFAIVMSVLLHIAIDADPKYPTLAPIPDDLLRTVVTPDTAPVILNMMLADGSGWELFSEDKSPDTIRRENLHRIFDELI